MQNLARVGPPRAVCDDCHGEDDQMISIERGERTSNVLKELVKTYEFHTFPYMGHEATEEEMNLVSDFICKYLPPVPSL